MLSSNLSLPSQIRRGYLDRVKAESVKAPPLVVARKKRVYHSSILLACLLLDAPVLSVLDRLEDAENKYYVWEFTRKDLLDAPAG